jgi:hypothetical protein
MQRSKVPDLSKETKLPERFRVTRLTYTTLRKLKPNKTVSDPAVRGLRYRCVAGRSGRHAVYAQFRYKHPATGKWHSVELGRLPDEEEWFDTVGQNIDLRSNRTMTWPDGTRRRVTVVSLDEALEPFRVKAQFHKRKLNAGVDPRSEAGPEGITLQQALALHSQRMRHGGKSESSIEEYAWITKRYLGDWRDVPLRKLTRPMVRERHAAIGKRNLKAQLGQGGPYAANKTMRALRAFWNTARRERLGITKAARTHISAEPEMR